MISPAVTSEQFRVVALQQSELLRLLDSLNRAHSLDGLFAAAMDAIQAALHCDRCSILLFDAQGVMRFQAARGLSAEYRAAVEGHSPWRPGEPEPKPICLPDVETTELEPNLRNVIVTEGIGALAFIPLLDAGELLGKFMVYYDLPHEFSPEELQLGEALARQLAFAIARKRTERELAENKDALEQRVAERTAKLQEMVTELQHVSYAITHDMRAPLRAMNAFSDLLLQEAGEGRLSAQGQDCCRRIMASAGRLDRLIQDALHYTNAVLREVPLQPVDLGRLLPSLIATYPNLQADKADIRIEGELLAVWGEEALLTQCFSNLLGNAVKFVSPGTRPRVCISSQRLADFARICVQDNGIGIPANAQHRLFGMFQRLTADYDGTGIGLAIVRKVVERMGGRVGVESEPGRGSRFWVELRLAVKPPGQCSGPGSTPLETEQR